MEMGSRMQRAQVVEADTTHSWGTALAALFLVACLIVAAAVGLVEWRLNHKDESRAALSRAGYTEVQIGRYGWFRCEAWQEPYATRFTAVEAKDNSVSGTVCTDLSSRSTVRLD